MLLQVYIPAGHFGDDLRELQSMAKLRNLRNFHTITGKRNCVRFSHSVFKLLPRQYLFEDSSGNITY